MQAARGIARTARPANRVWIAPPPMPSQPLPQIRCNSAPPVQPAPPLRRSAGGPNLLKLGSLKLSEVAVDASSPSRVARSQRACRTGPHTRAVHADGPNVPSADAFDSDERASGGDSGRHGSGDSGRHGGGSHPDSSLNKSLERGCLADSEGSTADLFRFLRFLNWKDA